MNLSIVIAVYRELPLKYTELCVDSLRDGSKNKHEIIVVVNPGTDISAYKHLNADIIIGNEPQGQCHANNEGIKKASNEWIMIADNDIVFPKDWEKGLQYIKKDNVLTLNSMEPISGAPGFVFNDCGNIENFDRKKFEKDSVEMSKERLMPGTTYPFIVEKKHLETIGGYDINFDPWGSGCDSDVRYKMMLLGLDLWRYFGVTVYHFSRQTAWDHELHDDVDSYLNRNRRNFEEKWNLAQAPSPQIWYSEFKLNKDRLRFKPDWMCQISDKWMGTEDDNQYWQCESCRYMNFNIREKCRNCDYIKK